jgi:NitT/TauT family transport system substrate-binding protein
MKKGIISAILLSLFAILGCETQQKKTVKIAYLPITHALPLLVASELQKELPSDVSIELVKFGSWPELLDALNTGRVDGASVLIELAMKAKEQGIGLKAVALGHTDGNVIIASNKINSPSDLKGKTIAIPHRQSSHFLLVSQMLKGYNMSASDVSLVELPPPEMPSALAAGQIEAYCVAEPFGARSVAINIGKVLHTSEDLWKHSLCCALVLTDNFINSKRETAEKFVGQYKTAGKYIGQNKERVFELTQKYLNIDKNVYDISMRWIEYSELAITKEYYGDLTRMVKDANLSENPPSYEAFVDSTLY